MLYSKRPIGLPSRLKFLNEVNIFQILKVTTNEKHLPCIKQYVLGQGLKCIITMTNKLTDTIFQSNSAFLFDILTSK